MNVARIARKQPAFTAALMMIAAVVVLAEAPARANHGDRTLEIGNCTTNPSPGSPCPNTNAEIIANEIEGNQVLQTHTIRAVLRNADGDADAPADSASGPINIDFEIESGPADPDGGNNPIPPDMTCSIVIGATSCEVQYSSSQNGSNTIRAWIDHDSNNNQIVNDPYDSGEARFANTSTDCGVQPPTTSPECSPTTSEPVPVEGDIPDPDGTDVIRKTWSPGPPAFLDCNPETATNPSTGSGSSETYTCTVTDELGNPIDDIEVEGENLGGANDPDNSSANSTPDYDHQNPNETGGSRHFCTTGEGSNPDGQCSDTVDAIDAEAGSADICFWADVDSDDTYAPGGTDQTDGGDCDVETQGQNDNDLTDTVTKTWQVREASGVDAEPETDTNDPGQNHRITATVYDQFGATFPGNTQVKFEFFSGSPKDTDGNTPASPDQSCSTNGGSSCFIDYTTQNTGRDLVCVWIEGAPSMSGDNTNGTCDNEGHSDADDTAGSADPPEPPTDDQDVVEKHWGAGPSPTPTPTPTSTSTARTIDCSPDNATNIVGTNHVVTCTVRNAAGQPVQGEGVTFTESGPGTVSPTQATTTQNGQATTTATSSETGNQTITGTITADTQGNEPSEVDECDRAAGDPSGAPAGQCSDTVNKTWTASQARSIDCEPETGTNQTGTNHVVTCTVRNAQGQPAAGEGVTFTESGPGTVSPTQATTNSSGQATTTATSTEGGTQSITGTITADLQGAEPGEVDECDRAANDPSGAQAGVCADTVEKVWEGPATQCSDGVDNDGDGRTDFPDDPGCSSADDDSEEDFVPRPCRNRGANENVIVGTSGADVLNGTSGRDVICGAGGNDVINGRGGSDLIAGGGGDDTISGGGGKDNVSGNRGDDNVSGNRGNDVVKGNGGSDTLKGNAGIDTLTGGGGNDTLQGGNHEDVLKGGRGNDTLRGGKGDDALDGGPGRDQCFGNKGNDSLRRCE